jgi:hypothetical protein
MWLFAGLANPDSTIDKLILWVWEDSIKRGFTGDDDNASHMVIHPADISFAVPQLLRLEFTRSVSR